MIQLVIALIVLIATVVLTVQTAKMRHGRSVTVLLPGVAIAVAIAATACVYSLDVGEVAVIRNLGGSVSGSQSEAGFHAKAPWQSAVKYDTRNNLINFYGDTDYETTMTVLFDVGYDQRQRGRQAGVHQRQVRREREHRHPGELFAAPQCGREPVP